MKKKAFIFDELSQEAKEKAVLEYAEGWCETHAADIKEVMIEAWNILPDNDWFYNEDGTYIGEIED